MISKIFNIAKTLLPRISETEMIALRSGTVSVDRMIFQGKINYNQLPKYKQINSYPHMNDILKTMPTTPLYNGKKDDELLKYLGSKGLFGFIIDKKYGGLKLSVEEQSKIITQISSHNPSLGVIVMVPNSLGPGELLENYGTNEQKEYYLPKLAKGEMIPCFGLTGPYHGSDAGGMLDEGRLVKKENGEIVIKTKINKRYITLAPVADLIGLAIKVQDPENLIGKSGITVALLEKNHQNLDLSTYHNPLNIGFPNGTIKGEIEIPLNKIIGGKENIGYGWKMLMECLAAGRGISLPASSQGSSLTCWYGMSGYANLRSQFKIPLSKMQGIQEKLASISYHSWITQTSIKLTNALLDAGEKPSVLSAIMKQQITERGRIVLNHAMDIHAGSAICLGTNNFTHKYYQAAPVGITVEGSNTLTRSLIIFGQGLNKSHPHIGNLVTYLQSNNEKDFSNEFKSMIAHTLSLYGKSIGTKFCKTNNIHSQIKILTTQFANLSNIVASMGGKLKKEQKLSGLMADYMSNLYLASSVIWYDSPYKTLDHYCLKRLINEINETNNKIYDELPVPLRIIYGISKTNFSHHISNEEEKEVANILWTNENLRNHIESQISMIDTLKEIKEANITKDENIKKSLIDKIIQVGEFPIIH